jgi:hypothetical protein
VGCGIIRQLRWTSPGPKRGLEELSVTWRPDALALDGIGLVLAALKSTYHVMISLGNNKRGSDPSLIDRCVQTSQRPRGQMPEASPILLSKIPRGCKKKWLQRLTQESVNRGTRLQNRGTELINGSDAPATDSPLAAARRRLQFRAVRRRRPPQRKKNFNFV